jgi:phosphatidylglycerophosphate synthase
MGLRRRRWHDGGLIRRKELAENFGKPLDPIGDKTTS